jgi:hypothetical protein
LDWSARVIVPFVSAYVVLVTLLALGILRLGDVITWPARWVAIVFLGVIFAPLAVLLVAAVFGGDGSSGGPSLLGLELPSLLNWIPDLFFPWL